jgi:protein O-mannosyl-transferase
MAKGTKKKASDNEKRTDTMPTGSGKSSAFSRKPVVHILIIVILGILIYSNTFNVPFTFDDIRTINYNSSIKDVRHIIDLQSIYNNRLIGLLTLALNYEMHGFNVAGYHTFNLFIHLLNALLVYWLIILIFRTPYVSAYLQKDVFETSDPYRWVPLFTALLFVSHPVQTQAVTYIVQRFASLATLFYLVSLVMYIKARGSESSNKARYTFFVASLISAILAMRTKEIAFTLPVMVFLYEFMFFRGDIKKRLLYLFPLLLTMFIIPLSMMMPTQSVSVGARGIDELTKIAGSVDVSRWDYLNTQFRVIVTYIRLLFFPVNQNIEYDYPIYRIFFTPAVFLSFLVLLGVFCWGIYLLCRSYKSDQANRCWYRVIAFGIFWFFVTLSVESSIIPIDDVIFEHRLYLPSVGFFVAFMSGIVSLYERLTNQTKVVAKILIPVMILMVIGLSLAAYARNMIWQDEVTLWEDVVQKSPHKARPHYNLGVAYQGQGRLDDAVREYQAAIKLNPHEVTPHYNLGMAYRTQGRLDDAVREYQAAIKLKPNYPEIYYNLGQAYLDQGRLDDAVREYQSAVKLRPNYADAHNNLGVAYQNQRRLDEAIKEYQAAINLKPDLVDAHYNLGVAYRTLGRLDDAIKEYQTAINLKPNYKVYYNLGVAYQEQGRLDDAIREYQTAINFKPDYADAHNNLGVAYQKQGRLDDAIREYQTAIRLKPDYAAAHNNLGVAYRTQGRLDGAIKK